MEYSTKLVENCIKYSELSVKEVKDNLTNLMMDIGSNLLNVGFSIVQNNSDEIIRILKKII